MREYNMGRRAVAIALGVALAGAARASADEVKKWTDAQGNLHYSITGSPSGAAEERERPVLHGREATADEAFSVASSLQRREIEKKLNAASRALEEVRARIHETEKKKFESWVPVVTNNSRAAQASLDAQRDALLAAQQFEQDKNDTLRRLHRREHEQLQALAALWNEFAALDAKVATYYGKPPDWWRKRLNCPRCPTAAEVDDQLHPARREAAAEKSKGDQPAADEGDEDEGWEKAWE